MQARFVGDVAQTVKRRFGLHVALDTQGFLGKSVSDEGLDAVDLVMLGIKHMDPARHLELTGKPLQPTLDFAERVVRLRKKLWIRYVLVPNVSDQIRMVDRLAEFLSDLASRAPGLIERVEVLPFSKLGEYKWRDLGLPYELSDTEPPNTERTDVIRDRFRLRGLFVC
jgi:pyruvate formate lyase activating enzyme